MRNRIDNGRLIFLLLLLLFVVPLLSFHSLLDFLRVNLNSRELLRSFVSSPSGSPDSPASSSTDPQLFSQSVPP